MKYYIKNAVLPFIYLFFMAITALGILSIGDNLLWLKVILCILNLGLYEVIACAYAFKLGQDALKVRSANDLERKQIIMTGEPRPLKLAEEYKTYKGFIIGLMTCAPLIILLAVHTVIILCGGGNGAGVASSIIYLVVYSFFRLGTSAAVTAYTFYFALFALPVIIVPMGVSYYLGGRKIEMQHKKIEEQKCRIYGDKN